MKDTCSVGSPTVERTINIVTKAALGTLATPMLVAVDAILLVKKKLIASVIKMNSSYALGILSNSSKIKFHSVLM